MEERDNNLIMKICLTVKTGPLTGHKYFADTNSPILIGRSEEANIRIAYDDFCSRKHSSIYLEKDICYVENLNSTNGTYVNGVKIDNKHRLYNDDIISLGTTDLVVTITDKNITCDNDVIYND